MTETKPTKKCRVCGGEFPLGQFYKGHATCKSCVKKRHKKWRDENPDKIAQYRKRHGDLEKARRSVDPNSKSSTENLIIKLADERAREMLAQVTACMEQMERFYGEKFQKLTDQIKQLTAAVDHLSSLGDAGPTPL